MSNMSVRVCWLTCRGRVVKVMVFDTTSACLNLCCLTKRQTADYGPIWLTWKMSLQVQKFTSVAHESLPHMVLLVSLTLPFGVPSKPLTHTLVYPCWGGKSICWVPREELMQIWRVKRSFKSPDPPLKMDQTKITVPKQEGGNKQLTFPKRIQKRNKVSQKSRGQQTVGPTSVSPERPTARVPSA